MSKIEVNAIEPQCGTTLTLGANDDKIVLGTGASFGGGVAAINWETTVQSGDFGALSGRGYFVDSSSAARTVTLPASPSAGDTVAVSDYAQTSETNNITIARNGSNIQGDASDLVIQRNGVALTLVYVDATKGWIVVDSGAESDKKTDPQFVEATGGTVTCCGDYKIHTFTGPGTFTVSNAGNAVGSNSISYLVIGGGAGGGSGLGSGGGAGGFREGKASTDCYTASPLNAPAGLPVTVQGYPITVGGGSAGGAAGAPNPSTQGSNSVFSTIISAGGGSAAGIGGKTPGGDGGSGGGGGWTNPCGPALGGNGNTPPVSPSQGFDGGASGPNSCGSCVSGGGGGGATVAGSQGNKATPGCSSVVGSGDGGNGATTSISGSSVTRAGGGGAGAFGPPSSVNFNKRGALGGSGGGGNGGHKCGGVTLVQATAGTTNTGSGGGGGGYGCNFAPGGCLRMAGANGGSGIVIIRYKFQ